MKNFALIILATWLTFNWNEDYIQKNRIKALETKLDSLINAPVIDTSYSAKLENVETLIDKNGKLEKTIATRYPYEIK